MRAMERLVDEGKVRHIGVSNLDVEKLEKARAALKKHPLVASEALYHVEGRGPEERLIPHCASRNMAFVAYSPLGGGEFPAADSPSGRALAQVAARHGATPHQVALNFLVRHQNVFAIPKAETLEHVRLNATALDFALSREDVATLEKALPRPPPGAPLSIV